MPSPIKLLSSLIASHAGLVKIIDLKKLPEVFLTLSEQSMVGLYVLPKVIEKQFVQRIKSNITPESYDFGIKKNRDYFFYIVDGDNYESSTGIYEIVSYGVDANYIAEVL